MSVGIFLSSLLNSILAKSVEFILFISMLPLIFGEKSGKMLVDQLKFRQVVKKCPYYPIYWWVWDANQVLSNCSWRVLANFLICCNVNLERIFGIFIILEILLNLEIAGEPNGELVIHTIWLKNIGGFSQLLWKVSGISCTKMTKYRLGQLRFQSAKCGHVAKDLRRQFLKNYPFKQDLAFILETIS